MINTPKILAFAGSLRRDSTNKKTVRIAANGADEAGGHVTYIDLKDYPLPLYDGDLEAESGLPENAEKLQELMLSHVGFLISSPEYNSSISGALKNVIDWTSRANGDIKTGACYSGKVASIMSASPGGLGGLRGLFDLRKILSTMDVIVLPKEATVSQSYQAFDENSDFIDKELEQRIMSLGANIVEVLLKLAR